MRLCPIEKFLHGENKTTQAIIKKTTPYLIGKSICIPPLDKELVSQIYKELTRLNNRKPRNHQK